LRNVISLSRFADKSLRGRTDAEEFESESDDLADNSEDEKNLRSTPNLHRHEEAADRLGLRMGLGIPNIVHSREENCEARWGIACMGEE
jgi:hypothetical protein